MKKTIRYKLSLGLTLLLSFGFIIAPVAEAAGETAILTPATGTTDPGNTFDVSVDGYVGSKWWGGGATSVEGSLAYPATLLKITAISTANSAFGSSTITPNNTNGTLSFQQTPGQLATPKNKPIHLFTITFQSLAVGTANVSFGTVRYSTGTASTSGATYTIAAPPAPSPSPTPTPQPPATPNVTPKPLAIVPQVSVAPTVEETPAPTAQSDGGLKIENVSVIINRLINSVEWTVTNPKAESTLTYGTSKGKMKSNETIEKQANGRYKVVFNELKLGSLYYFAIKTSTADNLQGASYNGSFTTKGYPVKLIIKQNNLLQPNAKVKIGERSFVANKDGVIVTEFGDGNYTAIITPPGSDSSVNAPFTVNKKTIPKTGNPDLQVFTLNTVTAKSTATIDDSSLLTVIVGGVIGIGGIGALIGFVVFRRRRNQQSESSEQADLDLLVENYGTAINDTGGNMPEPNLNTVNTDPLSQFVDPTLAVVTDATESFNEQIPNSSIVPTSSQANNQHPEDSSIASSQSPLVDPVLADTDLSSILTDDEQLAPAVMQVESADQEAAYVDEPSAVYDEATGELDIIHHSAEHHPQTAITPIQPSSNDGPVFQNTSGDITTNDTLQPLDRNSIAATEHYQNIVPEHPAETDHPPVQPIAIVTTR